MNTSNCFSQSPRLPPCCGAPGLVAGWLAAAASSYQFPLFPFSPIASGSGGCTCGRWVRDTLSAESQFHGMGWGPELLVVRFAATYKSWPEVRKNKMNKVLAT